MISEVNRYPQLESLGVSPFEILYERNLRGPLVILKELWSEEINHNQILSTYQYVVDLRERIRADMYAHESLKKVQGKQNAYCDGRARSRRFKVWKKVLQLLPNESNNLLLQWKGPFEVVEVLKRMNCRTDVKGDIGTYHATIFKQYVERQSMTSHCLMSVKSVADVDEVDKTDEYSLDDCTSPTTQSTGSYKEIIISDKLSPEPICKVDTIKPRFPFSDP